MKIQNCPLCGSEANVDFRDLYGCGNAGCELYIDDVFLTLKLWNRIRIAPNGQTIKTLDVDVDFPDSMRTADYSGSDVELSGGEYTLSKNWMNPSYPKERE